MNYIEYHKIYFKFIQAKNKLLKIQDKIEDVMLKMISATSQIKDTITDNKNTSDKMLELTSKKIDLENEEKIQLELLFRIKRQKDNAESELRNSKNEKDKIYYKYFIDHIRIKDIAIQIGYTREYTYELLNQIKKDKFEVEEKIRKKKK